MAKADSARRREHLSRCAAELRELSKRMSRFVDAEDLSEAHRYKAIEMAHDAVELAIAYERKASL